MTRAEPEKPRFIVGLGASAGGLEALENFFDHTPVDTGAAFVVVMHLSRDFKSMLDELLGLRTGMKVRAAKDGDRLHANTVYVIQPNTRLEVTATGLKVEERQTIHTEGVVTAIDTLLHSIAVHWGKRGAAVILSGSGSDGAAGLRAVQKAGGFTAAQSPETAKFDPMPSAAIATGAVNAVESPDLLARTVIEGLQLPHVVKETSSDDTSEHSMGRIVDAVIGATTLKAEEYKHSTFERRVGRRMVATRTHTLARYADLVGKDPQEARVLSEELLIGVTDFFRDEEPFKTVKQLIVPQLIKDAHDEERAIRVWVAGCATGEEVYSIAILFSEILRDMPFEIELQIFASDISRNHLEIAARGAYPPDKIGNMPAEYLERYFKHDAKEGIWTVRDSLRKMVVFAPHDLLSDPPFTRLDLICCRNVLIYFSIEAQQRVLAGFAFGLRPGGCLFLGSSETIGAHRESFAFVDARQRIFKRTNAINPRHAMQKARGLFPTKDKSRTAEAPPRPRSAKLRSVALQPAYAAMLAEYAPPSLLVSQDRELVHVFGDANRFLKPPEGLANLDVADLIDPALKSPLIVGMERVLKARKPMSFTKIALKSGAMAGTLVDITLKPLEANEEGEPEHLLVLIDDHQVHDGEDTIPAMRGDELATVRHAELEDELARTREALQSTIEEIETANEELQASNEELMSANEELQSTNEELSSVNEELYSVNAEYHRQNAELARLTNDFDLLLNATSIGVLFLDEEAKITRFTGLAKQLFGLKDRDTGRPIANFSSPFENFDPSSLAADMAENERVVELESTDRTGMPWLIRAVRDNTSFGIVVTFIDISELRAAEEELRRTYQMLEAIRRATSAYFFEADPTFSTIYRQVGFDDFIGVENLQMPYRLTYDRVHPDDLPALRTLLESKGGEKNGHSIYRMRAAVDDSYHYIHAQASKMDNGNWRVVAYDVDALYKAERAMREQSAVLEATLQASRSAKAFVGKDETYGFVNKAYCDLMKVETEDIVGRKVSEVLPPALYAQARINIDKVMQGKFHEAEVEAEFDGKTALMSVRYNPVVRDGEILGFTFDGINVSQIVDFAEKFANVDSKISFAVRRSPQPVMVVNAGDGRIDYANDAAQVALGLDSTEFESGKFDISRLTPEIGLERWKEVLDQTVREGAVTQNDVEVFTGKDTTKPGDLYLEAYPNQQDGSFITLRVLRNEAKTRLIDDLRDRARRLSSSNRDLEQFTTVVAHDLRAPLRHITAFSEMLENQVGELAPEEIAKQATIISGSAKNLGKMVSGLLDYARIGLREVAMETCDLRAIINNAQQNLSQDIANSEAQIAIEGDARISGNPELLLSLFQNLLGNAIKYARPDAPPQIEVAIKAKRRKVHVSVTDNGIGIDPDFSEKIFQLFRRLHREDEFTGLGVGLTTCRKIAEMHKAEIKLDKNYDKGSRFIVGPFALKG